jgi:hypothetical protein
LKITFFYGLKWYFDIRKKLKSFEETPNIAVLAVSANAVKYEIDIAIATGFVEFNLS